MNDKAHDARTRYEAQKMTREEFVRLCRGDWKPLKLDAGTKPSFLSSLPDDRVIAIFGSGSIHLPNPTADGNPDHGQVGGIDVYRQAEAADGVALNKDWYAIYQDPTNPQQFYLLGPKRDAEHWIDHIPPRLAFAEPASVEFTLEQGTTPDDDVHSA